MRLLNLAERLRDAGVETVEVQGWRTRGRAFEQTPQVVVGHHTASNRNGGAMPSLNILIHGRSDLPGPLCQIGLSRRGVAYVIASGKANHAGPGQWRHIETSSLTVGIEAENDGIGEPWPAHQLAAYDLCAAVLLDTLDQPASMYCGHKEWALPVGRKIDPHGIDLDQQRGRIQRLLDGELAMPITDKDVDKIAEAVREQVMRHAWPDGTTTRQAIRQTHKAVLRIADMVDALSAGDGPTAKRIADEVRAELANALKE